MYSFSHVAVFSALFAAAAAIPLKRELVVNTVTELDVVTEMLTATVWVDATDAPAYHEAQYTYAASEPFATWAVTTHTLPATTSSAYVAPPPPQSTFSTSTTSTSQPAPQAPTVTPQPAPVLPSTTSIYVAPPTPTTTSTIEWVAPSSAYTAPASTSPVYTPPATTTSVYTPPASTTTSTSADAAAVTVASTSSHNVGDITYYDVGLGSCGYVNTDSEMVVAIPVGIMNKAKMCGNSVTISYQGATHVAQIVDTCMGCQNTDLDMSPTLFTAVAPNGDGRVKNVQWWFN